MDQRNEILNAFDTFELVRSQLESNLGKVESSKLFIPEAKGKWSVIQVMNHLLFIEQGTLRYIKKKMMGLDAAQTQNIWAHFRYYALKWFLNTPVRFKMPKQLPEPSNESSLEEIRNGFVKSRAEIKQLIEEYPDTAYDKLIFRHPFAGRFSLFQTICFLNDHYNHHIKQVDRILKAVENRGS